MCIHETIPAHIGIDANTAGYDHDIVKHNTERTTYYIMFITRKGEFI